MYSKMGVPSEAAEKFKIIGAGVRNAGCSICGSSDRDRLVFLYLRDNLKIFHKTKPFKILHIAPEKSISTILKDLKNIDYIMGDKFATGYLYNEDVKNMDLCDLPFIDNYFDLIICNHVLEHIQADKKAMKEIYRVLNLNGISILQVPVSRVIKGTIEYNEVLDPQKRLEYYGQGDHVRIYEEKEYLQRLKSCGFSIEEVKLILTDKDYTRYGLNREEKLYIGTKN
jgi:SAM-dependent methyltransferase